MLTSKYAIVAYEAPEAGSGGAGASGAAAPAAGGVASPAGGPAILGAPGAAGSLDTPIAGQPPAGTTWRLPDGVPDHLKADAPDAFAAKLFEDWGKQRQVISKFEPAKSVDDYVYTPSDKVKGFVGDLAKDPVYAAAREAALAAGVPKAAFAGLVGGLYEQLVDKGLAPKPYDPAAERAAFFGDQAAKMTPAQMLEQLTPLLNGAQGFVNGLVADRTIDAKGATALMGLLDTADGARAVLALQKAMGGKGLSLGGDSAAPALTAESLRARQADPRNDPNRQEFDRRFADETTELYKRHYR